MDEKWNGEMDCEHFGGIIRDEKRGCCGKQKIISVISCLLRNGVPFYADTVCRRQICRKYKMKEQASESGPIVSSEELPGLLTSESTSESIVDGE